MPSWRQIETEYTQARFALEQLLKEGGVIQQQTEELILNLDSHYARLKNRVDRAVPISLSLTSPLPPAVNRKNLKGILAYRAWSMRVKGALSPAISWSEEAWRSEVAFANRVPDTDNRNGLHATRLEYWKTNTYTGFMSGLVDCYGQVIEHEDGVIRAECARILLVLITLTEETQALLILTGAYEALRTRYPNVPVYVVSPYQKELIIWREILANYGAI